MPDVHQQVLERIKAPLFTLANGGTVETSYAVWAHVRLLVKRAPILFSTDYKNFYFRGSDSGAVKSLKLSMLVAVADAQNTYDIVTELTEYVTDADIDETIAIGDDLWTELRQAEYLHSMIRRIVEHILDENGDKPLASLADDIGYDQAYVAAELKQILPGALAREALWQLVEARVRGNLEDFYQSPECQQALTP